MRFRLFWLALWLAQVLPARVIADAALDPSWSQSLGRFLAQGLNIGEDYVFTYGPLGYFSTSVYEPALFWQKWLLWECAWRLVASWFVARALWDGRSRAERAVALVVLLAVPMLFDAFAFAVVVAVVNVLVREPRPAASVRALGYLLLGSLALVKFTFAVAAGATALALLGHALATAGRRAALRDAGFALGGLLLCWFAAGQGLANFWPWIRSSLAIASAYNEGLSKPAEPLATWIGLATLACIAALLVRMALARPRRLVQAGLALALAFDCFLSFKGGYVRGDDHTTYYLGFALIACWLLPLAGRASAGLGALCALLALVGIFAAPEQEGARPLELLGRFASRLPDQAHDMLLPWRSRAELEAARVARATALALPRIRERVGRDPVDIVSFHQGVALQNGLEYRPRPAFQSYFALTPELQQLDVRFYEGPDAPRWVLFKLETIDNRLPTMENSALLETLLRRYRPVLCERRELLLERRAEALPAARRTTEVERELAFGEELVLPAAAAPARLLSLDIRLRPIGGLAQFLYRAPEIDLESQDEFGNRLVQRIVPGMMRTGVLVDPCIGAGDGWVQFQVGARLPRLRALKIVIQPGSEWMYEQRFGLRLESVEGLAPPHDDALARELKAFVFERLPDGFQSARGALRQEYAGRDCWFVFAPASMSWTLPAGKHSLSGFFGMSPDLEHRPSSPSSCFRIALDDGGEQRLLSERWLDLARPGERGPQRLELEFEAKHECQLILATALRPGDPVRNAWCYWSEIAIR